MEVREFGGPEVLVPRRPPDPEPGPGEAVVEVAAALDTMIRSGRAREAFGQRPPYVPGNGVAGHVTGGDPAWASRVLGACGGTGPDVVFDGVGGPLGETTFGIVADGGRFSAHGAPGGGFARVSAAEAADHGVTVRGIEQVQYPPGRFEELVRDALAEAAVGRLRPVIGQVYRLDRAADAHAAIAARTAIGKTLLTP